MTRVVCQSAWLWRGVATLALLLLVGVCAAADEERELSHSHATTFSRQVTTPETDGIELPAQSQPGAQDPKKDPTKQMINNLVQSHVTDQANTVTNDNAKGGVITMNKNVIKRVLKGGMTDEDDDLQDEAAVKKIEEQDKKKLREEELKQQREEQAKQITTEKQRQQFEENQKQFKRELDLTQEQYEKKAAESQEKGQETRRKRDKEDKMKTDRELALVKQSTLQQESEAEAKKTLFSIKAEKKKKYFDEKATKAKERQDKADEEEDYKSKKQRLEREQKSERKEKEGDTKRKKERTRKDYQEMFVKREEERQEKEVQKQTEKQSKTMELAREVAFKQEERNSKAGLENAQKQQQRLAERTEKENEQRAKANEQQQKAAEQTVKSGQRAAEEKQKEAMRQQQKGQWCDCRDMRVDWFPSNHWISCPSGFLLTGMHRNDRDDLGGIDHYSCCRPCRGGQVVGTQGCTQVDWVRSFDATGWSWCPQGTYVEGFFKSSCNWIYCLEYAKCCQIQGSRGRADCAKQSDWWLTLDKPGWSRLEANTFITGLYRTADHRLHNIEEPFKCQWWAY